MRSIITLAGIDDALESLHYGNKKALKSRLIQEIREYYVDEKSIEDIRTIDSDVLVRLLWDTGNDPVIIRNRRKNLNSIKSTINTDLKRLYKIGKNPEGIIIGPDNTFEMSAEAKSELLESFTYSARGDSPVPFGKITEVLQVVNDLLTNSESDIETEKKIDQLKELIKSISEKIGMSEDYSAGGDSVIDGPGIGNITGEDPGGIDIDEKPDEEEEPVEELEHEEELEEVDDEELEEAEIEEEGSEDEDEPVEELEPEDELEEVEDEELEEAEIEEELEDEEEPVEELEPEEELEEVEDEELEEAEIEEEPDGDEELIEEIEPEEELEEVDEEDLEETEVEEESEDEVEPVEEIELEEEQKEVDEEDLEEVEEGSEDEEESVEEIEPEEELEEVDDQDLEEADIEEGPVEEIEPEEELEEIDGDLEEIDVDYEKTQEEGSGLENNNVKDSVRMEDLLEEYGLHGFEGEKATEKAKLLAEEFNQALSTMDRYYNQYILIPKGKYIVGSRNSDKNNRPAKNVRLNSFYFGKYPVINAVFEIFIEKSGYITTAERLGYGIVYHGRYQNSVDKETGLKKLNWNSALASDRVEGACWYQPLGPGSTLHNKRNHPVVQVSLEDAIAFTVWTGKRLPTEDEWEAASRTVKGYKFPWGMRYKKDSCNIEDAFIGDTTPVDKYKGNANSLGISDAMGNVLEWTIGKTEGVLSEKKVSGDYIVKGGSWSSMAGVNLSNRYLCDSHTSSNILGFRCIAY